MFVRSIKIKGIPAAMASKAALDSDMKDDPRMEQVFYYYDSCV